MIIGERVRNLRLAKGMNQSELANRSNLSAATISRIENGKIQQVKSEALKQLADALGVSVDYLIGQTEKLTPGVPTGADNNMQHLVSDIYGLGPGRRQEVDNFVRFLISQEGKKRHD